MASLDAMSCKSWSLFLFGHLKSANSVLVAYIGHILGARTMMRTKMPACSKTFTLATEMEWF